MKKIKPAARRQVHQYDKILKENLEAALPGLIKTLFKIHTVSSEELPDDIQHTKERSPDVLKKITNEQGETFILHVEFQAKDEPEMVYRMAEYFIMLSRRYKLPVRQYIIYLGAGPPSMTTRIKCPQMNYHYDLIPLAKVDYKKLLCSNEPEEKILAILGDFKGDDPEEAIERIVLQIIEASPSDFAQLRYIQQLRILSKLRNLHLDNLLNMDSIVSLIEEEKDILYIRGEQKGETKKATRLVTNLLLNTNFSIAKIASLAEVTEDFVKKVKATIH